MRDLGHHGTDPEVSDPVRDGRAARPTPAGKGVYAARLQAAHAVEGPLLDLELLNTKKKPQRFLSRHLDTHVGREYDGALVSLDTDPHAPARNRM